MEEKLFVQRRSSTHSDSGKSVFKAGLSMTSATSVVEPAASSMTTSPFMKEDELKAESDAGSSLHSSAGSPRFSSTSRRATEQNYPEINPFAQEHLKIFQSFEKCLSLRDKYMKISLQRLGDNPRDHDGHFSGIDPNIADVSGVQPDKDI